VRTFSVHDRAIAAPKGERVEITLEGAGATGYLWSLDVDPAKVRVIEHRRQADATAFGARGRESFIVEPLVPGATPLTLRLAAPWEDAPAESHVVTLTCVG
jgi:predicted secreted protein